MKPIQILCIVLSIAAFAAAEASAQRRDYLTDAEIELVRDAQQIDFRVKVLTTAADRRFLAIAGQMPAKENEKWGPMPTGTRLELISDVEKIIQKAVDDIDEVAARNNIDAKIFPKAVWGLADACALYVPKFKTLLDAVTEEKERGSILNSLELCSQVADAAERLPKQPQKDVKNKKNNDN